MEPLAAKLRPKSLDEFVGQAHLVGARQPLRIAIEEQHRFSFILWGPPGVGKTTLARLYAAALNAEYHELSAVSAGKDDIRKILKTVTHLENVQKPQMRGVKENQTEACDRYDEGLFDAGNKAGGSSGHSLGPRILFLDEIHRFNKAQQDFLLPYVESGELILIGATTENPSFEVIPALLSRCRVFILEALGEDDLHTILTRAYPELGKDASAWLASYANGDARLALTLLESTLQLYQSVTKETLEQTLQSKHLRYDKLGEEHYDTISAFIKSMRASQADAALYYLARMVAAGEDPKFIARRMVIFASEDIGLAQPTALVVANAVMEAVQNVGLPEASINLAHGVTYLANAPKDRSSYHAYQQALADAERYGNLPIPLIARNAPTKLMKNQGYGKNYELYTKENLLPEKLRQRNYFTNNKEDGSDS